MLLIVSAYVLNQKKFRFLSGLILGLALSKFTLAFPLMVYLAYRKQWFTLIISLGVQLIGLLGLVFLVNGSLPLIITNYHDHLTRLAGADRINLLHISGHFPHTADEFMAIGLVLTTVLFGVIWFLIFRHRSKVTSHEIWQYTLFVFLNMWGLLVFYMQQYDVGTTIFALSLAISAIEQRSNWSLSSRQHKILIILTSVSLFSIMSFPGLSYLGVLLPFWGPIRWKLMTFGLLGFLVITTWLWQKTINPTHLLINSGDQQN